MPSDIYQDKDKINPNHYRQHKSGVECITITEHMSFNLGNVIKYVWRADLKNGVEDLEKAVWYLNRELQNRRPKEALVPRDNITAWSHLLEQLEGQQALNHTHAK